MNTNIQEFHILLVLIPALPALNSPWPLIINGYVVITETSLCRQNNNKKESTLCSWYNASEGSALASKWPAPDPGGRCALAAGVGALSRAADDVGISARSCIPTVVVLYWR